jgi:predicted RNase H-like nuclease
MTGSRVLGVDACRTGWVGVLLAEDGTTSAIIAVRIEHLIHAAETAGPVQVVAVDIPMGLPDTGARSADLLARQRVGRRWPSVFLTPTRAAPLAGSHAEASAINRDRTGAGISAQAYGLRTKLLDVDGWLKTTTHRVVEVHPEVSFAALAGAPLTGSKHSWAGATHRRCLLAAAGITLADDLGAAGSAGIDDILDAAVAAWTARRVATGQAEHIPDRPETFSDGHPAAIWI